MRRLSPWLALRLVLTLMLAALPLAAQQPPINARIPPPPPPPEKPATPPPTAKPAVQSNGGAIAQPGTASATGASPIATPSAAPAAPAEPVPPPDLPAQVTIPAGSRIAVVLDTPLSTRISRAGQKVSFRTSDAVRLEDGLEIPPDTAFSGSVVEVKRPGGFGKSGVLRVKVDGVDLAAGASAPVVAHLESQDINAKGRLTTDNRHTTDLYSLAMYTLEGTLVGSRIKGGKGAAVGAGAGALAALIIMMSHRGQDVYLEPGMPFQVVLEQPVDLPGKAVWGAQHDYARAHPVSVSNTGGSGNGGFTREGDANGAEASPGGSDPDSGRPKLKRRPRSPQP